VPKSASDAIFGSKNLKTIVGTRKPADKAGLHACEFAAVLRLCELHGDIESPTPQRSPDG
jgi:hypothetical protein